MNHEDVRKYFTGCSFGDPCTPQQLAEAESELRQPIPETLRSLYSNFNGFLGPTDAQFFWPLFKLSEWKLGLVDMNRFLRDDPIFPQVLMSQCLFYGDAGIGPLWGLKADLPGQVILWDAEWGDDFEIVGTDIVGVWLHEKRKYDETG